ncbi:MAG: UbiH/UbiF/VisC/COQ6 family ubiquinone biosynthesis hydroxylase [Alphaproteobacteria bacterium]|nr:UbiH/UbiF/VisC/COQ6 family ubiquinone biosynthesis hydroxylase [Alphaproteobacteria bacterium]
MARAPLTIRPTQSDAAETLRSELIVSGGGLVGLTLAIAAAAAGLEVTVVDREAPPRAVAEAFDGRSSAIAFGSQRVLAGIGLWDKIAPEAEPIREIRVADGESPLFLHYDHAELGDDPLGYIVENRVIRRALFARVAELPNLRHLAPATVVAAERGAAGVKVELEDGRSLRGALLVGAEGRLSPLRRAAGIRTIEWSYPQIGIVCTVHHERPHLGIAVEHFLPAGPFAILPMTGDRSSIVWTERAAIAPRMMALSDEGFLAELSKRFGDFLGTLRVVGPRWSYPLALMHAQSYVGQRLALIGDAAHVIHPIAGQGLNLGLRDVAALAELIVDTRRLGLDIGNAETLKRYERWRRFDTTTLAVVTDGLNRLFSNQLAPLALVRDVGLSIVNRLPPAKRFLMRHAMGLVGDLPRLVRGERL